MVTAAELVAEVEPLSYPDRARHLALLGRRAAGTPELTDLLAELSGRSAWESRLALRLADVAGDLDHLRACLDSGAPVLVEGAIGPAVRHGIGADALVERLPGLSAVAGQLLVAALRAARDPDLADALLEPVRIRYGDRVAASVLVSCSSTVVDGALPELAWAVSSWRSLARRHPRAVLDHADRELTVGTGAAGWPESVTAMSAGVAQTAGSYPGRVLDLLEAATDLDLSRSGRFGPVLGALARHDPARVAALLVQHGGRDSALAWSRPGRRVWRALTVLGDDELAEVVRVVDDSVAHALLRAVAPGRRPRVLEVRAEDPVLPEGRTPVHDVEILDLLPWWVRQPVARLLLESGLIDAGRTHRLTARLPWSESGPVLLAAATAPEADDRALAYPLLVRAAAATRDRAVLEGLLTTGLGRMDREQDPVRLHGLRALAEVRADLLTDAAATTFGARLARAARSHDASSWTRSVALDWAVAVLRAGARDRRPACTSAGATLLAELAAHLEDPVPRGAATLSSEVVTVIHEALVRRLDADERAGRHDVLLGLAASLGPRAREVDDVQERLGRASRSAEPSTAARAARLWLDSPSRRDERVEELLRWDRSTFLLAPVAAAVATRRTDLLDLVLGRRPEGRFVVDDVPRVLPLAREAWRWAPGQQDRYAADLREVVDDGSGQPWVRAAALDELARLPGQLEPVRIALDDRSSQVSRAALVGLGRAERPELVLPDLLARVDGDQAHLVGPVLRRTGRRVPPAALAGPLGRVLDEGTVSARKEACRLLVELGAPGGSDLVVAVARDGGQHRDVRRAAAVALVPLLDDARVLGVLTQVADSPQLGSALLSVASGSLPVRHRASWTALVLAVARQGGGDPEALQARERATLALVWWVPWDRTGEVADHAVATLTDLGAPQRLWLYASHVLVAEGIHRGAGAPALRAGVDRLTHLHVTGDRDPASDATAERDLPARQRLVALVDHLTGAVRHAPTLTGPAAEVAAALAPHPSLLDLAAAAAEAAVPWSGGADRRVERLERLRAWASLGPLVIPVPTPERWYGASMPPLDLDEVVDHAAVLHADGDPGGGLVALRILGLAAEQSGWTAALRTELRSLRDHHDPTVRLAATRTHTAEE